MRISVRAYVYEGEGLSVTIAVLDSEVEWDAECNGDEPGYYHFVAFLSRLLPALATKRNIYACFTERGYTRRIGRRLRGLGLSYVRFPTSEPEILVDYLLRRVRRSHKGYGSGVLINPRGEEQIRRTFNLAMRGNERLFFHIGDVTAPDELREYEPFYVRDRRRGVWDARVLEKAFCVVYQEIGLAYAEIMSPSLKPSQVLSTVQRVGAEHHECEFSVDSSPVLVSSPK